MGFKEDKEQKNIFPVAIALGVGLLLLTLVVVGAVFLMKVRKISGTSTPGSTTTVLQNSGSKMPNVTVSVLPSSKPATATPSPTFTPEPTFTPTATPEPIVMLPEMQELYYINHDLVGYIEIEDTIISYPVVQTFDDPDTEENEMEYYIRRDFLGNYSKNSDGTLFMDDRSENGVGYARNNYLGGTEPSTAKIIYGHNMLSGNMFGYLNRYLKKDYWESHKIIKYMSLYEEREYEIISVFRSHRFNSQDFMDYSNYNDPKFKYYYFAGNMDQSTFNYWFANVMSHNELDIDGYEAVYGDEFLILSTCSSTDETGKHNDEGRLCVVAVRVK